MKFRFGLFTCLILAIILSSCSLFRRYGTPNLDNVQLTVNDLPSGYKQLTDQELSNLGITKENFTSAFKGSFSNATPQNFTVFINSDPNKGSFVFSVIFYPISQGDIADWNNKIQDPNKAAQDMAAGLGSGVKVTVRPEFSGIGDSSIGFSAVLQGANVEIIEARYFNVAMVIMYRYTNNPELDLFKLATTLNSRAVDAYKKSIY